MTLLCCILTEGSTGQLLYSQSRLAMPAEPASTSTHFLVQCSVAADDLCAFTYPTTNRLRHYIYSICLHAPQGDLQQHYDGLAKKLAEAHWRLIGGYHCCCHVEW